MLIARKPGGTFNYVSKNDPDKENPTVFHLKNLDASDQARIEDSLATGKAPVGGSRDEDVRIEVSSGTNVLRILNAGLDGWENFKDENGNEVEFIKDGRGKPKSDMFNYLPPSLRRELSNAITEGNTLSEEQEKNL